MAIKFSPTDEQKKIIIAGLTDPSVLPNTVAILRRVSKIEKILSNSNEPIIIDHDDFEFLIDRFKRAGNWNIAVTETETASDRIKKITAVEDFLDEAFKSFS